MHERTSNFEIIPAEREYHSGLILKLRVLHACCHGFLFAFASHIITDSEWGTVLGAVAGILTSEFVTGPWAWSKVKDLPEK